LADVARRFGTTPKVIADLNHLGNSRKLHGKVLIVPVQTRPEQTARRQERGGFTKYYTVKKGDTLTSLAKRFNVSASILSSWNNLKDKVALNPGKRLIVARYVEKKGALAPADESS
jgi:membrane-bound lytic murein transglycosylase D